MEEHIESKTNPVCFTGVCDYQLSKYDVACLPFDENMITHLSALVTIERRAQCPKCLFYGEFKTMSRFQKHVASCDPDDMVPCESCHCLYRFHQLDEHYRYCHNIPVHQRQEAFIDFIISKSKYPFTPVQVRYYIELQKQKRRMIDPHEIVDGLAAFERGNYWKIRAQQDASCRAQLDDYEKQQGANAKRNEELRRRYEELKADEELKAKTCRLCPHCKRVVQHMGGCSSMICGQNYHGGDQQSGCGKNFNWDQALPYIPIVNTVQEQMKSALENQQRVVHTGIRCKNCHKEIEGIRFDCIHCHSLNYCEICEQRCTLAHSEELRRQKKQQHVFRLVTTPEASHK
ncbi:unnamed protein product [Rotaria sp. Silwood1]|nr:unnamed protein product [Rotaria sp. Silwood1]